MSLRIRSHVEFQRAVFVMTALGGAVGLLLWALHVESPVAALTVIIAGAGAVLAGGIQRRPERDSHGGGLWRRIAAACAALPACLVVPVLFDPSTESPLLATVAGWIFGLVAGGLGQLVAQLEWADADPVARALERDGRGLADRELALASRAVLAHRRIRAGIAGLETAEARRLGRLSQQLALRVLALASRCHSLNAELGLVDLSGVRARAAAMADAAARTADSSARLDLIRAGRELAMLDERLVLSSSARERILARLELQATLLESTAFAVAARQASAVADDAAALAPLSDGLDEAAAELQAEAAALGETNAAADQSVEDVVAARRIAELVAIDR